MSERVTTGDAESRVGREGVLVAAGVVGAVLASSCCVVPVALVVLGLGGAWVGHLTALDPYQPYFLAGTAVLLSAGFWHVYIRPAPACAATSHCARPASRWFTQAALWLGTALAVVAASADYWAPFFY